MYALEGVKVIDFGIFIAGPWASKVMADLGADVIKVEQLEGEPGRALGVMDAGMNRGKRSLAINLKTEEGRTILYKLVSEADAVMHNMRLGVAERLGMGYEELRKINPRLIYLHSTGYGSRGPRAPLPTFETLHSAFVGILHESAGEGNAPVSYLGNADYGNGYLGAAAIMMALIERAQSGQGQFIECPQTAAALTMISEVYRRGGKAEGGFHLDRQQTGFGPLYRIYETAEGWICIDAEWAWGALTQAVGRPDLAEDERFAREDDRETNALALSEELETAFRAHTANEWLRKLDRGGVPAEVVADYQGAAFLNDDVNLESGLVAEYQSVEWGRMREIGQLIRLSETPGIVRRAGPALGEHTQEILRDLGYVRDDILRLRDGGIVTWDPRVESELVEMP